MNNNTFGYSDLLNTSDFTADTVNIVNLTADYGSIDYLTGTTMTFSYGSISNANLN